MRGLVIVFGFLLICEIVNAQDNCVGSKRDNLKDLKAISEKLAKPKKQKRIDLRKSENMPNQLYFVAKGT